MYMTVQHAEEKGGGFLTGVSADYVQKAKFLVSPVKDAVG